MNTDIPAKCTECDFVGTFTAADEGMVWEFNDECPECGNHAVVLCTTTSNKGEE